MIRRVLAAAALTGLSGLLLGAPAHAADGDPSGAGAGATIAHVETVGGKLKVLVDVPAGAKVDLSGVTATLDDKPLTAIASSAGTDSTVQRTAILAVDTSDSMADGGRFTAAKAAALTFLNAVPADVRVGIVTFDKEVTVALPPTTDRTRARGVVLALGLHRGTHLYDGLLASIDAAGTDGQRSIVLLSDGADTGSAASLASVTAKVRATQTAVDAVTLGLDARTSNALRGVVRAGGGELISSSGSALAQAFHDEADILARQILVTASLPEHLAGSQATVAVALPTGTGTLHASALAPLAGAGTTPSTHAAVPEAGGSWSSPGWLLYVGIAVLALGMIGGALLLVPGKPAPMTIADRLTEYTARTSTTSGIEPARPASEPMLEQAKAAATAVLEHNQDLDRRLTQRLTSAGSQFKPSEWLLLHFGIVIAAVLLGALVGGGNILVALLFAVLGAVVPLFYLRWAAGRRRKAFDTALPETLQLLAGALSAGLSLAQAVDTITREGPEPIAAEFKRVLLESRLGISIEDAFEGVADRFNSKDFAWVVMAIRIQRQVGGNLAEILTTVAATMRERAYLRRQVNALAAEGKLSALILSLLPPGVTGFVLLTNGSYFQPMFQSTLGWLILIGASVWLLIGIFWMSRLVKVEI